MKITNRILFCSLPVFALYPCLSCDDSMTTDQEDSTTNVIPDDTDGEDSGSNPEEEPETETDNNTDSDTVSDAENCIHPEVVEDCNDGYCRIPAGCYIYGSPETEPCRGPYKEEQTAVTLTRDFVIAQTETTQDQWEEFGFPNPSQGETSQNHPVNTINWFDTLVYLNSLSERDGLESCYDLSDCQGQFALGLNNTGLEFTCDYNVRVYENIYDCPGWRLPTRAEWSYAARAGTLTATYNGDITAGPGDGCVFDEALEVIAWHCGNTDCAMSVGTKQPNPWGLYDMIGNVFEWTEDEYDGWSIGHGESAVTDPTGPSVISPENGMQGGSAVLFETCNSRASTLYGNRYALEGVGFRAARTLLSCEPK